MNDTAAPQWPGFWARIFAFCIDSLVLGIPLTALGWAAFDTFAALGSAGRFVGLAVGVAYFGLLESRIGKGQSLGKRLLKLQVRAADGGFLSFGRAAVRSLIKIAPIVANGFSAPMSMLWIGLVAAVALVGLGLAQLYLYIADRPIRRGVHDLVSGTTVVRVGALPEVTALRPIHRRVATGIIATVAALLSGFGTFVTLNPPKALSGMLRTAKSLEAMPDVISAQVSRSTTVSWSANRGGGRTQSTAVVVRLNKATVDQGALARRVALVAISGGGEPPDQRLTVMGIHSFELGFATGFRRFTLSRTVAQWRAQPPHITQNTPRTPG